MSKLFDMALLLSGVLTGSKATQQRAIQQRWKRDNPWTWQLKHVRWFLDQHLKDHSDASRYYRLTALMIWKRLGKGQSSLTHIRLIAGKHALNRTPTA